MKKWVVVMLSLLVVIVLVVGIVIAVFYNKYSDEIAEFKELKAEADILFDAGVTGPDECDGSISCARHCSSNSEDCAEFCVDNPENELCGLIIGSVESGDVDLSKYEDADIDDLSGITGNFLKYFA
jgi:hypothetical protein